VGREDDGDRERGGADGAAGKARAVDERWQQRFGVEQSLDPGAGEIAGADCSQSRRADDFVKRRGKRVPARAGDRVTISADLLDEEEAVEEVAQNGHPEKGARREPGD